MVFDVFFCVEYDENISRSLKGVFHPITVWRNRSDSPPGDATTRPGLLARVQLRAP